MDGSFGNLRLFPDASQVSLSDTDPAAVPLPDAATPPDPIDLANRELIRPPTYRRGHPKLDPFSAAWFDELELKRYARHGKWLPGTLEFGRHPGESVLLLGPGMGGDAVQYLRLGTQVTIGTTAADHPELIHTNLARHGLAARLVPLAAGTPFPFADGAFDVVTWNALHEVGMEPAAVAGELYRVLKPGGKVIGLFPARYDAGYWQDVLLPLQRLFWRRPPDPTLAPKTTRRELQGAFAQFSDHRFTRRHLRRGELPYLWRVVPLAVLERLVGRVLVVKAFKPLSAARTALVLPALPDARAA